MRLTEALPGAVLHGPAARLAEHGSRTTALPEHCIGFAGPVRELIPGLMQGAHALVAILSVGATVRLVAPYLRDKRTDPAVVAVDETGRFAVPIAGGHLGGANALARRIGCLLGAWPVVTTASDVLGTLAVDLLGKELGWQLDASHDDLLRASAAMVNGEPVALVQEAGRADWWQGHAGGRKGPLPPNLERLEAPSALDPKRHRALLWFASHHPRLPCVAGFAGPVVRYRPPPGNAGAIGEMADETAASSGLAPPGGSAGRSSAGKLFLVGLGPGAVEHMTVRAREAIAESDTLIGLTTYLRLISGLSAGKRIIPSGMTEELARVRQALEMARAGHRVALVSSGDSGVYGMAGAAFEVLSEAEWTAGADVSVEVVPGTTAMIACAALVGAPLGHDFCAISLSDLLTPWPLIARRLAAAAAADFVIALYNPRSHRRTAQIEETRRLLLALRRPDTPVALVRSAYRPEQRVLISTLGAFDACEIDMQTTVMIGNSRTRACGGFLVTPRGYGDKYDLEDGRARPGERGGRSLGGGLETWLVETRSSAESDAELARRFGLPVEYIAAVRATIGGYPT
ncbi:precorrin-3 C-17 methylase [Imhoffiella purpurea]|uniref:Precorrin-3 C-17 methylase n=2 Tax=Imhoffiella purpurea TaxID=1249627 RepID=W9VEJ9_9GAMM|nr:precorrin-3 C-17 methylase [Imhoffiella purpurea]